MSSWSSGVSIFPSRNRSFQVTISTRVNWCRCALVGSPRIDSWSCQFQVTLGLESKRIVMSETRTAKAEGTHKWLHKTYENLCVILYLALSRWRQTADINLMKVNHQCPGDKSHALPLHYLRRIRGLLLPRASQGEPLTLGFRWRKTTVSLRFSPDFSSARFSKKLVVYAVHLLGMD